jgi:ATP-dependent Clp protease adapter protein ClpS
VKIPPPSNRLSEDEPAGPSGPGVATPDVETIEKTRHCPRYKVFVHNDDVTPMILVVDVLRGIFGLDTRRAMEVMVEAHNSGIAFVTALSFEQAEFRVEQAHSIARGRGYPLTFTYEPE